MQKPFFSVIIPTLNEEKYLPKLLSDLAKQTFADFDVWVVDSNSDDKTQSVVKKFAKTHANTHLVVSQKRHVSVQRNLGAQKSAGGHLLFLDADSRIPPYFLEGTHYNLMREPTDLWTYYSDPDTQDPRDILICTMYNFLLEAGTNTAYPFLAGACVGCARKVFDSVKGFDEKLSISEDIFFGHDAVKKHFQSSLYKEPRFVFNQRRHRKEGYMTLSAKMLPLILQTLQGKRVLDPVKSYPMLGGRYFDIEKKSTRSVVFVKKHFRRFQSILRAQEKEIRKLLKDAFVDF